MTITKPASREVRPGTIIVCVSDKGGTQGPLERALISVYAYAEDSAKFVASKWQRDEAKRWDISRPTDATGCVTFPEVEPGSYVVAYDHFPRTPPQMVTVESGCTSDVCIKVDLNARATVVFMGPDCKPIPCKQPRVGDFAYVKVEFNDSEALKGHAYITTPPDFKPLADDENTYSWSIDQPGDQTKQLWLKLAPLGAPPGTSATEAAALSLEVKVDATHVTPQPISGSIGVTLQRTGTASSDDLPLWVAIRNSTEALSFNNYLKYMNHLFCGSKDVPGAGFEATRFNRKKTTFLDLRDHKRFLPFTDADAYRVVKVATEAFVMVNCGVLMSEAQPFIRGGDEDYLSRRDLPLPPKGLVNTFIDDYLVKVNGGTADETLTLPYLAVIRAKLPDIPIKLTAFENAVPGRALDECFGILQEKLNNPCLLELIWSYWHEEGALVQTMNVLMRRFQNVRAPVANDPLANLEIDPLRPLNNLFWGYIQDEQHRLTVVRRNYEYDHHYGLRLEGKAVIDPRTADSRSKFLEAFHNLLRVCTAFFKQDDDTTVKADAFPVLNALKEVHLILSQGAHNQFGDLPSTARIEMLMQQWLLARPEFREFLPTRIMMAYPEPWMDRVDAMKKLQGWTDASALDFRNLAAFGEQLLLSIRWGYWTDVQDPVQAFNWARFFRPQIQGYIHAYRAVTGVDLTADLVDSQINATLPSVLMKKRLALQQRSA